MTYIVACPDPELLAALRAFAALLATLPDPRGVRHPLPVLLGTLLVALDGGATAWPRWPPSRTTTEPGSGCGCPWARPRPPATPTCAWCAGWTRRRP